MGAEAATGDLLRRGREALAAADWDVARACFEEALAVEESAEALDGLAQAAHYLGDYDRAIALGERAFAAHRARGAVGEAARVARWLAFFYFAVHANLAAANGWMARAESLLEGAEESVDHGWLALDRAPWSSDATERSKQAMAALAIARRFGDRDLEFGAIALLGETHVAAGRVAEGMTLLDEAMAAASGGEVRAVSSIGEIYCRMLSACEHALDVRRAEEWLAVAGRFVAWRDFVPPTCRTHYGGILVAIGRWPEAEAELLGAIRVFEGGFRAARLLPLVRLAELRVRQGRYEEAERLLEGVEWHPAARRALAAIALARGDPALASELAGLCLEGADPADPACVPVLELLLGAQLDRGDLGAAAATLHRLAELARNPAFGRAAAAAELAAGRLRAAEGDARAASHLRAALEAFSALGLPLEAARARLELAAVLAASAREAAIAEARLALRAFERLGALHDADRAAALLRDLGAAGRVRPRRSGTLTARETEVLALLAAGCSNAEIGARLYISPRTAEHHVASILAKLDVRSRAEAAAYAVRERPAGPVSE